ncbi:unnamed protein product [Penicillium viridicatum]
MPPSSTETDRTVYDHKTRSMAATEPGAIEGHLEEKAPTTASSSSEKLQTSDPATDVEKANPAGNDTSVAVPNLVDWDGPDDPANPQNWSKTFKMANVLLVSLSVLYCNLATTMFSPGAKLMKSEFGFKSDTVEISTITIASLGFAVGQFFVPPRRLTLMMWVSPLFPIGLFIYGWTVQYRVHWVVPIIGTAISGPGAVVISSSAQTYIIDIFGPQTAASAMGALTILRNLTGAFLPLAAPSLYAHLHMGWGNSVLAFITISFIPIPFLFYWKGEWLLKV